MHFLVGQSGPLAGRRFELSDEVTIGRENATITLADEQTSRRHAAIRVVAGTVVIEDLGSTNGTFVDDRRIQVATALRGGETIRLGEATFVVEIEIASEPAANAGATRLAKRPRRDDSPEPTGPRRSPPPASRDPTMLRSSSDASESTPSTPEPTLPAPKPLRQSAPASPASALELPFGTFSPPAPRRRRGAASRKLAPTVVSLTTIIATATALVVYFAGR